MRKTVIEQQLDRVKVKSPFFWQECRLCKDKIKKEVMWAIRVWEWDSSDWHYYCMNCCPEAEDVLRAEGLFEED